MQLPETPASTPLHEEIRRRPFGTQSRLAEHLGVSESLMSLYVSGRRTVPQPRRQKLAEALGLSETDLFPDASDVRREVDGDQR